MSDTAQASRDERRWAPVLSILVVFGVLKVLPHHVYIMPEWVAYGVVLVGVLPMIAVMLATDKAFWLWVERTAIMVLAAVYAVNTAAELADMIGMITLRPPEVRSISLLSSSLAIWLTNVLTFSLLYWQIDRGGPSARLRGTGAPHDWLFPQTTVPEVTPVDWRPRYLDYMSLAFNTATAFSPTDVMPLSRRAKMLMTLESTISLLTLVIVAARAVNVLP